MKYLKIKNDGNIEVDALHLLGASSKRNELNKIGQFGSGNKYALAYLLRNNFNIKIFSGLDEINIELKEHVFRNETLSVVYLNGERTSITSGMGYKWEFWQAMRELYCNAIDEGGDEIEFVSKIEPKDNETHFYIETNSQVMDFVANFDTYFSKNKKVLFETKYGKILEKTGDICNVYRKGIKCFTGNKNSIFDYDFNDIAIDENRLVKYYWEVEQLIWKLIFSCTDKNIIKKILTQIDGNDFIESQISDYSCISNTLSEQFKEIIKEVKVAPISHAGYLKEDERGEFLLIPQKVYKEIVHEIPGGNIAQKLNFNKQGIFYSIIEPNKYQQKILDDAIAFLKECNFKIPYDIKLVLIDNKDVLGSVDNETILITDICIENGVSTVVSAIIEEFIHIKYKVKDETRGFQTSIINEFVSYMKKHNAYII